MTSVARPSNPISRRMDRHGRTTPAVPRSSAVRPATRIAVVLVMILVAPLAARGRAADADSGDARGLRFTRVHVPRGKLSGIPLGPARYVPMSAQEFEEAVARVSAAPRGRDAAAPGLEAVATSARYALAVTASGTLSGSVTFDIAAQPAGQRGGLSREMPLGELAVRRGSVRTAAGTGEAVVFGRPGGGVAVATPEPGEYTCLFECGSSGQTAEGPAFALPLVPALFSSVVVRVPAGLRPVLSGDALATGAVVAAGAAPSADGAEEWRIDVGPLQTLDFVLATAAREPPLVSVWTDLDIRGRQASLAVTVVPQSPWDAGEFILRKSPSIVLTHVRMADGGRDAASPQEFAEVAWTASDDGRTIAIFLPSSSAGHRNPILLRGVAPIGRSIGVAPEELPAIRPPASRWAGGGVVLQADPSLSLAGIELQDCLAVTPEVAARWPLLAAHDDPAREATVIDAEADAGSSSRLSPPRVALEHQGPDAAAKVLVNPRVAELDIARVTTVDVSPGIVLGRTACDVRVNRGVAFDLAARVAAGWFIDSVEAVDAAGPAERTAAADPDAPLEWKVVRDPRGDLLKIGLTMAATPDRSLGLRITGHRAGVATGASFSSAEMDMVRIDGETEGLAVIEFRTNAGSAVEAGATVEMEEDDRAEDEVDPRLAALAEEGTLRGRVKAGPGAPARRLRLVRRRPPLDARTQVRLSVRDDKLAESFTFECIPDRSELDAIVVHFTEPLDDRLEWSLLPPATGTITARRMEQPDRRRADGKRGIEAAESWMIELSPPAREAVTIRAVRAVSFTAPVAFPLAWIEGATNQVGEVIVRDAGRRRPRVVNRRLRELPPGPADAEQSLSTVVELSFDAARDRSDDGLPAAELVPGDGNEAFEARAWAWRAITSCWCHASGITEYETLFEIENHGRATVAFGLIPGKRLQGILIDGVGVPLAGQTGDRGLIAIELPAGKRFVRLLVRSLAEQDPRRGLWRIDALGGTIDVPVLDHEWRVLLPPELDIAVASPSHRAVGGDSGNWTTRLLAAALRPARRPATASETPAPAAEGGGSLRQGFRERLFVPAGGHPGGGEITIVSAGIVSAAAILAAFAAAGLSIILSPRGRPWPAVAACLVAAIAALWVPEPFDAIARAAWWGTLAAVWLRSRPGPELERSGRRAAALLAVLALAGGPSREAHAQPGQSGDQPVQPVARGDGPMRVFMTPVDRGETALVPEELFRVLARSEAAASVAAVRVIESRVIVGRSDGDHWQLLLDVDADAGGVLAVDQTASGARWVANAARIDGAAAPARIERGGRLLQLTVNAAGRRRIELEIEPSVSQRGEVVVTTAGIPVAPSAVLERAESPSAGPFSKPDGADREQCEAAASGGVFIAARRTADRGQTVVFDVARAAQVRLVRPIDPRTRLAGVVRKAASRNEIAWELDACRLVGTYTIDPGDEIVRSVVVRADPRLELAPPERPRNASPFASTTTDGVDDAVEIRPISGHRYVVDRLWPTRGPVTLEIPLRMPLADPAGVFAVPEAWLEDVAIDDRTTRLTPAGDLSLTVDLADGAIPIPPRDSDPAPHPQAWWVEVSQAAAGERAVESPAAVRPQRSGTDQPARVTVERRRQDVRGSQNLAVTFAADQIRLQLQARLDASSTALFTIPVVVPAACEIDRVRLFEDDALEPESAERGAIDLRWSRRERGRIVAVVQRPRSGRFRLEVDARLPGKPPATGPLPLLHAELTAGAPVLVTWRGDDGTAVTVRPPDGPPADRIVEHAVGRPAPLYAIAAAAAPSAKPSGDPAEEPAEATTSAPVADATIRPRVELADIHLMADERGRAWGMVRFDLVAATPELLIELPPGMRLFDLLIDGHAAGTAVPSLPHGKNAWSVRLLDVRWPRSVLAVFAGELATRLVNGGPLVLPAPAVIDLPCDKTLWTLHVPDGVSLRVAEPARVVDEAGLSQERRAAMLRLEGDFERAMAASDGLERARLEELVRLRKEGAMLPLEAAWERVMAAHRPSDTTPLSRIAIVAAAGGQDVTVYGARRRDPTVPGRAVATLSLLAIGGLVWTAARRRPEHWARRIDQGAPLLAMLLGCAWLLTLAPMLPGLLLLVGGGWAAVSRRTGSSTDDRRPAADDDSSTTQIAPAPASPVTTSVRGTIDSGN